MIDCVAVVVAVVVAVAVAVAIAFLVTSIDPIQTKEKTVHGVIEEGDEEDSHGDDDLDHGDHELAYAMADLESDIDRLNNQESALSHLGRESTTSVSVSVSMNLGSIVDS